MLRKILMSLALMPVFAGLCGCESLRGFSIQDLTSGTWKNRFFSDTKTETVAVAQTHAKPRSSIVVCRSHQCAPAKMSMTREYIFNSLLQLFDNNNYQKMLVCQADPFLHTCIENYITLPIKVGVVPTQAYIDSVKITDVIVGKKGSSIDLILNYNLTYGGQVAECTPAKSLLFARNIDHVLIEDSGYNCKMTTIGTTHVKTVFTIDYIDLDYGYIGGYYSIGMTGPAYGGNNDYMILRMPRNAYPLSPALKAPKAKSQASTFSASRSPTLGQTQADDSQKTFSGGVQIFPLAKKEAEPSEDKTKETLDAKE
jgi:hypothetical protein